MKHFRARKFIPLTVASLFLLAGCADTTSAPAGVPGKESNEPVTLSILGIQVQEEFDVVAEPLKKKYPYISFDEIAIGGDKGGIIEVAQNLLASGKVPDIITGPDGSLSELNEMNLLDDLTPLIKTHNYDVSLLEDNVLAGMKAYSSPGTLNILPRQQSIHVLYYNKDLFDKFGVAYPKDGMTWPELKVLAQKVTRTDNGTQYRGFDFTHNLLMTYNQLSQPVVDPGTNQAVLSTDSWKQWFETFKSIYDIEGNKAGVTEKQLGTQTINAFLKDRTLAMTVDGPKTNAFEDAAKNGFTNWDIVSLPSFPGKPGVGDQMEGHFYAISPTSKNKAEAFKAISFFASEEAQIALAHYGKVPVLKDPKVKQEFMKGVKVFEGKNLQAFFKNKPAVTALPTKYDRFAYPALTQSFKDYLYGRADVNTALREAEEQTNQSISGQAAK